MTSGVHFSIVSPCRSAVRSWQTPPCISMERPDGDLPGLALVDSDAHRFAYLATALIAYQQGHGIGSRLGIGVRANQAEPLSRENSLHLRSGLLACDMK